MTTGNSLDAPELMRADPLLGDAKITFSQMIAGHKALQVEMVPQDAEAYWQRLALNLDPPQVPTADFEPSQAHIVDEEASRLVEFFQPLAQEVEEFCRGPQKVLEEVVNSWPNLRARGWAHLLPRGHASIVKAYEENGIGAAFAMLHPASYLAITKLCLDELAARAMFLHAQPGDSIGWANLPAETKTDYVPDEACQWMVFAKSVRNKLGCDAPAILQCLNEMHQKNNTPDAHIVYPPNQKPYLPLTSFNYLYGLILLTACTTQHNSIQCQTT